jgi:5-methylcytosine-specific restriction protein A
MTRTLLRRCIDCPTLVRGKPRCVDCQRKRDQAKRARRPDLHNDAHERERRRRVVADHRAIVGDWCPGWERQPAHQSADLTADHVREVARGGKPDGKLVVRCRSCNAARSAHLARRALAALASGVRVHQNSDPASPISAGQTTPCPPNLATHTAGAAGDDDPGPVAA